MAKVGIEEALAVIREVFELTLEHGQPLPAFVVLLGGTALAAHGIRLQSGDVDFFAPEIDDEAVYAIERKLKDRYGDKFRIDATVGENIWGDFLIRDIAESPEYHVLEVASNAVIVKTLTVEDLFFLKLAAFRDKDRDDLVALADRTSIEALSGRLVQIARWHGNRSALPGFLDLFVTEAARLFVRSRAEIIGKLEVPPHVRAMLLESGAMEGLR